MYMYKWGVWWSSICVAVLEGGWKQECTISCNKQRPDALRHVLLSGQASMADLGYEHSALAKCGW